MKARGSVTVEAAVIIPLFTIIVVNMVLLAFTCHDRAVISCAETKTCVRLEFLKDGKDKVSEMNNRLEGYLSARTIGGISSTQIEYGLLNVSSGKSVIVRSNPVSITRITNAAKKLVKEDGAFGSGNNE